ncbi:hypothetical protein PQX77_014831, partial [Marasmius sp. AFHP31]
MPPRRSTASSSPSAQDNGGATQRAPRRCKKCPGPPFPLVRDCVLHSKRAAARTKKQGPIVITSTNDPTAGHSTPPETSLNADPQVLQGAADPTSSMPAAPSQDGATATAIPARLTTPATPAPLTEQSLLNANPTSPDPFGLDPQEQELDPQEPDETGQSLTGTSPDLLSVTGNSPLDHYPSTPSGSSARGLSPGSSTPSTPSISRRARLSRTYLNGQRQRACNSRPLFGKMTIKRRTKPMDIVRTGSLTGLASPKSVNRKFVRRVESLLLA